jgi:hypothetical protein
MENMKVKFANFFNSDPFYPCAGSCAGARSDALYVGSRMKVLLFVMLLDLLLSIAAVSNVVDLSRRGLSPLRSASR